MNRLLAGELYKVTNSIVEGYQQYLFSGYRGRSGAERLRKIIEHTTALSVPLHTGLNTQELRQPLTAFLDKYAGHDKAVRSSKRTKRTISKVVTRVAWLSHSMRLAVKICHPPIVSEARFRFLGEVAPVLGLKRMLQTAQPSQIGQSVEHSIPAVREICSNTIETDYD
ncbi:hypothetical protein V1524DRAFT_419159 [Lipomyces starkeyi]